MTNNFPIIIDTKHGKVKVYHPDDHICRYLLQFGSYEWYVVEIIDKILSQCLPGIVLDVGANIGIMTLPLAAKYTNFNFHMFEIQPEMCNVIDENVALNSLINTVLHKSGLGDREEYLEVKMPDYTKCTNIGAFSLNSFVHQHSDVAQGTGESASVSIVPLDSLTFDQTIQCIKLDVEGYEMHVLLGAEKTLKQNNYPPIIYELWRYNAWWSDKAEQIKNYLRNLGYNLYFYDDAVISIHNSSNIKI